MPYSGYVARLYDSDKIIPFMCILYVDMSRICDYVWYIETPRQAASQRVEIMTKQSKEARLYRDTKLVAEARALFLSNRGLTKDDLSAMPQGTRDVLNRQWHVSSEKAALDIALACNHDLPCADAGLVSYRYKGAFGFIMIGAKNNADAINEAARSIDTPPMPANLEVWNGYQYVMAA